jgi:hypothetical protein
MENLTLDNVDYTRQFQWTSPPCPLCGKTTILVADIDKVRNWRKGKYVQHVWPELSADIREVVITGTHPECWDELMSDLMREHL